MSDWSEGILGTDPEEGSIIEFDRQAGDRQQEIARDRQQEIDTQQATRSLTGDPFATGTGSLTGGGGGLPTDSSSLDSIAKFFGVSKDDLLKRGIATIAGGFVGNALGNRANQQRAASKVAPGGIQSFEAYTPKVRTAADYTGRIPAWVSQAGIGLAPQPNAQPRPQPTVFPGAQPGPAQPSTLPYGGNAIPTAPGGGGIAEYGPQRPNRPEDRIPLQDWLESYRKTKGGGTPLVGLGGIDVLTGGASGYPQTPIGGWTYAAGGQTPTGLGYLRSAEDGMADRIPATIDGKQPAKLSGGEFVIPADVVSHLGNGNSDAGAKQLHDFMARIRKARTGNQAQGKRIDPAKFFPKGRG